MPTVKSVDDLKKIKEQATQKRDIKTATGQAQVTVAMGTCGIAAGARDTMKAVLDTIDFRLMQPLQEYVTSCSGGIVREHNQRGVTQVIVGRRNTAKEQTSA